MSAFAPEALEARLGYTFARPELLQEALTHSTWANEHGPRGVDYERLEFLGDAVLSVLVSHALFVDCPGEREGSLSRKRAQVVREESLAELADTLSLGTYVRCGQGQREAGVSASILADVLEALIAAVYLDGGLGACEKTFGPLLRPVLGRAGTSAGQDAKTRLQELCHVRRLPAPVYRVVAEEGPSHARTFVVTVQVEGVAAQDGRGRSKKVAEQACAARAYAQLAGKS